MTDKSQSRERFEKWHADFYKVYYVSGNYTRKSEGLCPTSEVGQYWREDTEHAWQAWQAALADQPAVAGAAGEELAQLRALANNAPNIEALPADAFYLSYQKWCREYLLPCLTRTAAPSPAVGGEEK